MLDSREDYTSSNSSFKKSSKWNLLIYFLITKVRFHCKEKPFFQRKTCSIKCWLRLASWSIQCGSYKIQTCLLKTNSIIICGIVWKKTYYNTELPLSLILLGEISLIFSFSFIDKCIYMKKLNFKNCYTYSLQKAWKLHRPLKK